MREGTAADSDQPFADAIVRARAVLFDVGGTLLHMDYEFISTLPACRDAGVRPEALKLAEVSARTEAASAYAAGHPDQEATARYFRAILGGAKVSGERLDETIALLRRRHDDRLLWSVVQPGTREGIQEIRRRGYVVGVVSNADGSVERLLNEQGFSGHFDFVLDSARVGVQKPDPRIFRLACERAGVPPSLAVYVGDVPGVDVLGARRAGLIPVLMDPGDAFTEVQCLRVHDITEFLGMLPQSAPASLQS